LFERVFVRRVTDFYHFYYNALNWAQWIESIDIIVHSGTENGNVFLRLLPSEDAHSFQMSQNVKSAVSSAGGTYMVTDLDGAVGMSLLFPLSKC